jgi:hypothetical protein
MSLQTVAPSTTNNAVSAKTMERLNAYNAKFNTDFQPQEELSLVSTKSWTTKNETSPSSEEATDKVISSSFALLGEILDDVIEKEETTMETTPLSPLDEMNQLWQAYDAITAEEDRQARQDHEGKARLHWA